MMALAIFTGAGLGGLARYGVGSWVQSASNSAMPWATLTINVTGSFLLLFLYALMSGDTVAPEWRAFAGIGFCGVFTTFSTFSLETLRLMQGGDWRRASTYIALSLVLSIAAALVGLRLGSAVAARG